MPPPPPSNQVTIIVQMSSIEMPRFPGPGIVELSTYQGGTFNPQLGPIYYYHPLTPYDMAAFEQMMLNAEAYSFINGELTLVGHAGLASMFEQMNHQ